MSTPVNFALNKANEFLRIAAEDHMVKQVSKVGSKVVSNVILTVAAAVETVVLALLTAITSPLRLSARTKHINEDFAKRLEVSASTVREAAINIVSNMKKVDEAVEPTLTSYQEVKIAANVAAEKLSNNKGKIASAVVASIALVLGANYARGLFAFVEAPSYIASKSKEVYNLVQGIGRDVCPLIKDISFDTSPVPAPTFG